jgi:WD40 repeat protein
MIDFSIFEKFQGKQPYKLLDQHPDGNYLAMQVQTSDVFSAAIWNEKTGQLAWSPEDAHALAWLQHGTQIAALQNPILDEASFLFAIYSWPQGHLIHQCALRLPMGYLFDLIISPKNDLAICQWTDQCEFGFEFIDIHDHSAAQIAQKGYINRKTNVSTRPVLSPDGYFWICCYQENTSWRTGENNLGS